MIVINFWGGPDSGKSTQATGLFHRMKSDGYSVEIVNEFAKMCVWEDKFDMLQDQFYVSAKQNRRVMRLEGKVDFCITDSPLMLGAVYRDAYGEPLYSELIDKLCYECYNRNKNINFFMKRSEKTYEQRGREQDYQGALRIDEKMYKLMKDYNIPFYHLDMDKDAVEIAYKYVLKRLVKNNI